MLIEKPRCNFKNCRFYFDGNCRSADIYENCKLTDLRSEIAKLTVDLDNAKTEVEDYKHNWQKIHDSYNADCLEHYNKGQQDAVRQIFEEIEKILKSSQTELVGKKFYYRVIVDKGIAELKKKYTEGKT